MAVGSTGAMSATTARLRRALARREIGMRVRVPTQAVWQTHDNGTRPFTVFVTDDNGVRVEWRGVTAWSVPRARRILVGRSPQDHPEAVFSHAGSCDGNSVLVELSARRYVFVGHTIVEFNTVEHVRDNAGTDWRTHGFLSPLGNSDVPYPYAIDEGGRRYLLLEGVRLRSLPQAYEHAPYAWYYRRARLTHDHSHLDPARGAPLAPSGVARFYLGPAESRLSEYTFTYTPFADAEYDRLVRTFGQVYVCLEGERTRVRLTRERFCSLVTAFGREAGFSPIRGIVAAA